MASACCNSTVQTLNVESLTLITFKHQLTVIIIIIIIIIIIWKFIVRLLTFAAIGAVQKSYEQQQTLTVILVLKIKIGHVVIL